MTAENKSPAPIESKKVPFVGVESALIERVKATLLQTQALRDEVTSKVERLTLWREELKKLMGDQPAAENREYASVDQGIEAYLGLLTKVFLELSIELESVSPYAGEQPPAELSVAAGLEHLSATEILERKIETMRKEARAIKKDLQVSFSRYEHGIGSQLNYVKQRAALRSNNS